MDRSTTPANTRLAALKTWISGIDAVAGSDPEPASGDASFRRYFRLRAGADTYIVMDAPPEQEDCLPFVRIAGYLEAMQLNAPQVIEANLDEGFLLLSDLGSLQYLDALLEDTARAPILYADAMQTLLAMQERGAAYQSLLPPYDSELLRFELSLFHDWLCEHHLGMTWAESEERSWQACCDLLVTNALDQPQVFVHRDYHSRNLMLTDARNPGLLDFQDAVEGPLTYDLVSLLKDCYIKWPAEQVWQWAMAYYNALAEDVREQLGVVQFRRYFDLMGAQRHLKAAGIFARLNHRDGKSAYLRDIPQALSYIVELGPRYPELDFVTDLITSRVLPGMESDR